MKDMQIIATGVVTIDTEEYRELVERDAYLKVIISVASKDKYHASDICNVVKQLLSPEEVEEKEDAEC